MRVFLSWSGERSREVARALRDWLPGVLQTVEPWLSSEDMPVGARWSDEIAHVLQSADVGIICLTPENLHSPWLMYEAGALSKRVDNSLVCTYGIGLSPADISGPLAQFQNARAEKADTFRLIRTLNEIYNGPNLPEQVVNRVFEANWPWLEARLLAVQQPVQSSADAPTDEKIDELLTLVRELVAQSDVSRETPVPPETVPPEPERDGQPRVFIGSSTEGLAVAEAIQLGLDGVAECTIWNQSAFDLSRTPIEGVVDISREFDFAILVLTADDMLTKRGKTGPAPRDNLLFELGLFTGALGRARTFMVYCRDDDLELPSDLAGVTAATFSKRSDGNLHAALGPVCTRIKRAMGVA